MVRLADADGIGEHLRALGGVLRHDFEMFFAGECGFSSSEADAGAGMHLKGVDHVFSHGFSDSGGHPLAKPSSIRDRSFS